MKKIRGLVLGVFAVAALTMISASYAAASCLNEVGGADSKGSAVCLLSGQDADWCYYDCICDGDCTNVYDQLGLVDA